MSDILQVYKLLQDMRDRMKDRWNSYKSFALQGGRIDSNTLEIKIAEDKICEKIQKELLKMFPEELAHISKE